MSQPAQVMSSPAPPTDSLREGLFHARHHALLGAILENLSEGVLVSDASGNVVYFSPFAEAMLGHGILETIPDGWDEQYGIFYPDMKTPLPLQQQPLYRALQGEVVKGVELFVRNMRLPQGVHMLVSATPTRDGHGNLLGVVLLLKDLNRLRQAEAELRRKEQRFQLLLETAREGVWAFDTQGRTTYVNRAMARMVGCTVEEMRGRTLWDFLDEEGQRLYRDGEEPRRHALAETRELLLWHKEGRPVWGLVSTSPIREEEGRDTGTLAMVTDVTSRHEAQEEVRRLNAQLERRVAERTAQLEYSNRELEAFAYSVAHDLRAPLRGITSFGHALVEECREALGPEGQEYLDRMQRAALRMGELIDGILALSRVNRAVLEDTPCDLSAMARAVVESWRTLQPDRKVSFVCQEGLVDRGDARLLRGALENLLGNAWKFTRRQPEARIEFGAREEDGRRVYYVRDNGAGFDMAYQGKLFGVFHRLHGPHEFEGNGVGLATVQRIIRRHGGRVWGEGAPGLGATFSFTLHESAAPRPISVNPEGRWND